MRFLLFFLPIGIWCGMVNSQLRTNWYYVTSAIACTCIVFFYNFPFFTKWMHTRPVYFEDLYDPDAEPDNKDTHQRYFMSIMNLFLTIIICMLFNYAIYQSHEIPITPVSILTIIGSLCGLHAKVQSNVGSVLMIILHYSKRQNQKRRDWGTCVPPKPPSDGVIREWGTCVPPKPPSDGTIREWGTCVPPKPPSDIELRVLPHVVNDGRSLPNSDFIAKNLPLFSQNLET